MSIDMASLATGSPKLLHLPFATHSSVLLLCPLQQGDWHPQVPKGLCNSGGG